MAVWITVGFFETHAQARVDVAGAAYQNSFTCIPMGLPVRPVSAPVMLGPGMPLQIVLSPGPLLSRLEVAFRNGELLPYFVARLVHGGPADVFRLQRVRVSHIWRQTTSQTRQVTLIQDV